MFEFNTATPDEFIEECQRLAQPFKGAAMWRTNGTAKAEVFRQETMLSALIQCNLRAVTRRQASFITSRWGEIFVEDT